MKKRLLKIRIPVIGLKKKRKKLNGVCFGNNNIIITTAMLFFSRFHRFRGHMRDEEATRDDLGSPQSLSFPPWFGYLFEQLAYLNRNGTSSLSESRVYERKKINSSFFFSFFNYNYKIKLEKY